MTRRTEVEWVHPRLRVAEVACPRHVREIVAALTVLGMGSASRLVVDDRPCVRCENAGVPFRDVVRGMLATGGA